MAFLWALVPHRKERKALEGAVKPANAQERKTLRQFGRAASNLLLRETKPVSSEHSLKQLEGKLLEVKPPAKSMMLRANLTPFVLPGLILNDNLFPVLAKVLIIVGMKKHNSQVMVLQVDYNKHTRKLSVEIPSMVPQGVLETKLVKAAIDILSIKVEHDAYMGNTKLVLHAERA